MSREPVISGDAPPAALPADDEEDRRLRPQRMGDMIGQQEVYARLEIALNASRKRAETLGHILFDGPPGPGQRFPAFDARARF